MAAPQQIGDATVFGLDGTLAYTGLATTDNLLEGITFEDAVEEHESRDKYGEVIGVKLFNPRKNCEINFYPSKPKGAGAIAGAKDNVILPAKGAKVTLAGFPANSNLNSANWIYFGGGRIELTNTGECKMVLPLRQYNTDLASVVTS